MDTTKATTAFAALSQPTRLDVFRLLVQAGKTGLLAGEIGEKLDVRQNTMSANLLVMPNAGLIRKTREGRGIRYFADMPAMADLIGFMLKDCCGGNVDECKPFLEQVACKC